MIIDDIYIRDSAYTDATAFKNSLSGVYLVYEKLTPTTTTETAQPIELKAGSNVIIQTSGEHVEISELDYQGKNYDIALNTAKKYLFNDNGVFSILTNQNSVSVNGDEDNLVDLTRLFGSGQEPSTANDCFALYPILATKRAYNEGTAHGLITTAIKTTNRNVWDEDWELGGLGGTGLPLSTNNTIRTKNFIRVLPNTTYYFRKTAGNYPNGFKLYFYDQDYNFISFDGFYGNGNFTTPKKCCYIKWFTYQNVYTYENDICINISDPTFNGQYVAHQESTRNIPITTIQDHDGEIAFPYGLLKAGNASDVLTSEYAESNIGIIDLGTLNWYYNGYTFSATLPNAKLVDSNEIANMTCHRYITTYLNGIVNKSIALYSNGLVYISDHSYNDGTALKQSLSGVLLYYEKATTKRITFDNDPTTGSANITNPINLTYDVLNNGMEIALPNDITSAPFSATIKYQQDYVAMLNNMPKTYISKESFDSFATAMSNLGIDIQSTWNDTTQKYDITATNTGLCSKETAGNILRNILAVKAEIEFEDTDVVDLSTLTWYKDGNIFYAYIQNKVRQGYPQTQFNAMLCSKYQCAYTAGSLSKVLYDIPLYDTNNIVLKDNDLAGKSANEVKAMLSGVLLAYKKA